MDFIVGINSGIKSDFHDKIIYQTKEIVIASNFLDIKTIQNEHSMLLIFGRFSGLEDFSSINCVDAEELLNLSDELEGRFILILITEKNQVFACSDKYGKLDIFYQQNKVGYTLASNLDLFIDEPQKDGFNQEALIHMLTYYGYCPPKKHTLYNSINRIDIGECICVDEKNFTIHSREFFPESTEEYSLSKHDEYSEIFLDHLRDVTPEVGAVVYFSSGWDSTSIVAGLVHLFGNDKVEGVIGRMLYSDRSGCCNQIEIDKAQRIAEYFGIKLSIIDFDLTQNNKDYFGLLSEKMRKHQLYAITGFTHDQLASKTKELANSDKIVFAGEISDGAHNLGFSQYATIFHPSYGFREYSDKMSSYLFGPTFLDQLLSGKYVNDFVFNTMKDRYGSDVFDKPSNSPTEVKLELLTSFFLRNARMPFWSISNEPLLTEQGRQSYTRTMQSDYLTELVDLMDGKNLYSIYLHLYNKFHWQGSTVRSLQTTADYYELNSNLPFWNYDIQKFLSKMPESWGRGLDLNPTKYPLKSMLKEKIDYPYDYQEGPHSYTYDTNHSFSHAQEIYCYSALVKEFQDSVVNRPYRQILSEKFFNLDYIDGLVDKYINSPQTMDVSDVTKLVPVIMLCYVGWYGKE